MDAPKLLSQGFQHLRSQQRCVWFGLVTIIDSCQLFVPTASSASNIRVNRLTTQKHSSSLLPFVEYYHLVFDH